MNLNKEFELNKPDAPATAPTEAVDSHEDVFSPF